MHNIVIAGGAGGIGSATVERYSKLKDTRVIVGDIDEESGKALVERLQDESEVEPVYFNVNVQKIDSIKDFVRYIKTQSGAVSHLINIAGRPVEGEAKYGLEETDTFAIRRSIDLNLTSNLLLIREFEPLLEGTNPDNHSVVLTSSINALRAYYFPAYSAAKAGLLGIVRQMSSSLGKKGIRINAVLPGATPTPGATERVGGKIYEKQREGTALGRLNKPEDVADVYYALTHVMKNVTGQTVVVDGGQSVMPPSF